MCFSELEQKECLLKHLNEDEEKLKEVKLFLSKIVLSKSKNKSLLNLFVTLIDDQLNDKEK